MNLFKTIRTRFRSLWQRPMVKREIDEELQFHIEARTAENVAAGMPPQEAAREARKGFGNYQSVREECRDARGAGFGETTWQDIRFGLRMLRKNPGPTTLAIGILSVGIAATASLYSVVKGLLLDPLPYPDADRLVQVWTKDVDQLFDYRPLSPPDFLDLQDRVQGFEAFGVFSVRRFNLGGERSESVEGAACTPGVFRALNVPPLHGRWFASGDEHGDAAAAVILSHQLWRERFASDPDCVGRSIRVDGREHTVVGVMPESFQLLSAWTRNRSLGLWTLLPTRRGSGGRAEYSLGSLARLKPGISARQAGAELQAAARDIAKSASDANPRTTFWLMPLSRQIGGVPALRVSVLLGAGWTLLALAAQNVAAMLLARGISRQSETAIRIALGAGRARIVRLVLTESLLMCVVAGVCGFGLTIWCVHGLAASLPAEVLPRAGLRIDAGLVGCLSVLTLIATQWAGLTPALLASKTDVIAGLKEGGGSVGSARRTQRKLRNVVIAQIVMAILLVNVAMQLSDTYRKMLSSSRALLSENVLTTALAVKGAAYDDASRAAFWKRFLESTATLPGIRDVAVTTKLPFSGGISLKVLPDNETYNPAESRSWTEVSYVSPGFLSAIGARLLLGRFLLPEDSVERWRHHFVVINRSMADRYWPGQNPVGHHIRPAVEGNAWSAEVVGVIEDLRQVAEMPAKPEAYFPYADAPFAEAFLVVRTAAGVPAPINAIRQELRRADGDLALADIRTMEDRFNEKSRVVTVVASIVDALTVLILGLAGVGLYGTLSFYFAQRQHEIGVRLALGAGRRDIRRLVFRQALVWVAIGVVIGVAGAWLLAAGISSALQDALPISAAHIGLSVAVVMGMAALAAWIPARRAARIDPMLALRCG